MLVYTAILYYIASSNPSVAAPSALPSSLGSQFANGMISSFSPRDTDAVNMCPRTRLEIIWTCLATILAASWVAVHPNMPGPNVSKVKKILWRIELMLWAIIAPELIILWAMQQWYGAKVLENKFISSYRKPNDAFKWTKKHGFFLQMGGFVLHAKDGPRRILDWPEWEQLMEYYKDGRVDLSKITEATIDDHSKADGFAKCIALIQTSWFIVQSIARLSDKHLLLTELELVTAALAVLSLFMYCFWWNKPFNAEVPIVIILLDPIHETGSHQDSSIKTGENVLPVHTQAVSKFVHSKLLTWDHLKKLALMPHTFYKHVLVCMHELTDAPYNYSPKTVPRSSMRVPHMFHYLRGLASMDNHIIRFCIGSHQVRTCTAVFGAIHCAGWSDKMIFHTDTASLWRISSVIITASPSLWILTGIIFAANNAVGNGRALYNANDALFYVTRRLSIFSVPFYIIARIILLILAFMELRYVPQGALNSISWANVLPFIHW
ncbi:hypothetical protein CPC08DRAFT_703949 [Agrocybe pediades]|nr:hypothetical protein CPC08DRAFT_703949 [Agrocybe pediades]